MTDAVLINSIENTSIRAGNALYAGLPHVLTVAGLGDEARAMLTAYATPYNLATVADLLVAHLGDNAHRVQGWVSAVRGLAAADRDYARDVARGDVDRPEWAAAIGEPMLGRLVEIERIGGEIAAEAG